MRAVGAVQSWPSSAASSGVLHTVLEAYAGAAKLVRAAAGSSRARRARAVRPVPDRKGRDMDQLTGSTGCAGTTSPTSVREQRGSRPVFAVILRVLSATGVAPVTFVPFVARDLGVVLLSGPRKGDDRVLVRGADQHQHEGQVDHHREDRGRGAQPRPLESVD